MLKGALFVIAFALGCMYLPFPLNAYLMGGAMVIIVLGIVVSFSRAVRNTSQRFWNAIERRDEDDSDYIPYITTKYRRDK